MSEPAPAVSVRQPALFATSGPLMERLGAACFASLPPGPGVYRFYGEEGRLLYIGQSSNLRARVGSYRYVNAASHSRRIVRMVARAFRVEWEPCASAAEAIALESRLLLEHAPPFNRAGVWQPPPWWLLLTGEGKTLHAALGREAEVNGREAQGPLPSGFRYTFGALMRCALRWQWPELKWWSLPAGMSRAAIPPEQMLALSTDTGAALELLHAFVARGCPEALDRLTIGIAAMDADSPEGMFWTADADTLQRHAVRAATLPGGQQ